MSSLEVPPFDLLFDQDTPYGGFGDVLTPSPERDERLRSAMREARGRIEDGFRQELQSPERVAGQLDEIIHDMWADGWDPGASDMNLFVRDFGLVLTDAIVCLLGGVVVWRSEQDVSHLSIRWSHRSLEAFPFHKVVKSLYSREGESIELFVGGLSAYVLAAEG